MSGIRDRLLIIGVLLVLWQSVVSMGLVSPLFLTSPLHVGRSLIASIGDGSLFGSLAATLLRATIGFSIGAVGGVLFGIPLGYFERPYRMLSWLIDFIRSVPITALLPLFVLLLGIGDRAQVAAVAWAAGLLLLVH